MAQSVAILRLADRVEYQMSVERELNDKFVTELEQRTIFEYTNYDATMLRAVWPRLITTLDEGRSIIGKGGK